MNELQRNCLRLRFRDLSDTAEQLLQLLAFPTVTVADHVSPLFAMT